VCLVRDRWIPHPDGYPVPFVFASWCVFAQEPGKLVQQAWRFKHWPAGHFSTVVLKITEVDGKCKLALTQKGVPDDDLESTKAGWKNLQWDRMKAILGFGSNLSIF
jgi:activator of HSP90 ATPase